MSVLGKIFVGGMPYSMDEEQLRVEFGKFGTVTDIFIVREREDENGLKKSKGYGFISFEDATAAEEAIKAMDSSTLAGRKITVNYATKPTNGGGTAGGMSRGRGNFRGRGSRGGYANYGGGYGGYQQVNYQQYDGVYGGGYMQPAYNSASGVDGSDYYQQGSYMQSSVQAAKQTGYSPENENSGYTQHKSYVTASPVVILTGYDQSANYGQKSTANYSSQSSYGGVADYEESISNGTYPVNSYTQQSLSGQSWQ
ncbi:RNA-binding protein 3 [Hydra vulgaris]|uniref:RNA-binding protein 3 n=1 Tax=Hydra vulgaris TaxID=6087 RepID=UPI0002B4ADC3|nr:RNA-binding protein 3 [Hydra vulgaris]